MWVRKRASCTKAKKRVWIVNGTMDFIDTAPRFDFVDGGITVKDILFFRLLSSPSSNMHNTSQTQTQASFTRRWTYGAGKFEYPCIIPRNVASMEPTTCFGPRAADHSVVSRS
jgi:hypothetical protein